MNSSVVNLHIKPTPGATDEALAVSSSAVQLTKANWLAGTKYIVIQVQDDAVRYTVDDSAPTSSNGIYLAANTTVEWSRAWAAAAKFIRVTGDAVVFAQEATD